MTSFGPGASLNAHRVAVVTYAIVASLDPLFTVLIEDSSSDPTARGILKFMANFIFLATTYLLADILPVLARLSQRFQRSQVDSTTVTDGVHIDESTDIATDHNLVMYIRYVINGEVCSRFLCLVNCGGTAREIIDVVLKVFMSRKISLTKLCGIATDGAGVMIGCRTGVTTQLKGKYPFIISIHCIAHQLALASGQAADAVPYVKQYQLYFNNIYRYFHYSTKHAAKLKARLIQSILQLAERKFHQVFHTRWLSFEGAVDARRA